MIFFIAIPRAVVMQHGERGRTLGWRHSAARRLSLKSARACAHRIGNWPIQEPPLSSLSVRFLSPVAHGGGPASRTGRNRAIARSPSIVPDHVEGGEGVCYEKLACCRAFSSQFGMAVRANGHTGLAIRVSAARGQSGGGGAGAGERRAAKRQREGGGRAHFRHSSQERAD